MISAVPTLVQFTLCASVIHIGPSGERRVLSTRLFEFCQNHFECKRCTTILQ